MKRIIISVTNDLATDQRVKKVCESLLEMNFEIVLIGRKLSNSLPLERKYKTIRMPLFFNKGFLFYAEYNIRLFIRILFLKKGILLANDLDTLLPNYLISKLFSKKLVYDSHELYTEVPELIFKPRIQKVWLTIENLILPKLKNVYTVNDSIASFYKKKYNIDVKVIRNIAPILKNKKVDINLSNKVKGNHSMLILQGSGINIDRGAEEVIAMMQYLDNVVLYIIGGGDIYDELKYLVSDLNLTDKVVILNKMPYDQLMEYTKIADLGLSLDKGTNLNYEYSLPNKVFDYIQAQIPLFVSNRIEVSKIVSDNNIGFIVNNHDPKQLAYHIDSALSNKQQYKIWKKNLAHASKKYCWESEKSKLQKMFSSFT